VLIVELGPRDHGDEDLDAFPELQLLSAEERERAARFVRPRDRRRFLVCRGALRQILGQVMGESSERVEFHAGPGGKPELAQGRRPASPAPIRFNVSHSADLALIAVSGGQELGVDLERLRSIREAERIVESYFTLAENAQFLSVDPASRDPVFLRGWTRKEAILKARGVGLAGLATSFETMFGTGELSRGFTAAMPVPRIEGWTLWEASPQAEYVAALAVHDPG
jgi:4'-phosphopantetheinyl transferase